MRLESGKTYINREGKKVKVEQVIIHGHDYHFVDSEGKRYNRNGRYIHNNPQPEDLTHEDSH